MNHLRRLFIATLLATAVAARAAEVAHFVEYIESDGAGSAAGEYVLLDYKPTARSVVEMDVTPLDLPSWLMTWTPVTISQPFKS